VERPQSGNGGHGMIQRLEVRETSAHELGEWAAMRAEMMLEIGLIGATEVDSFRTTVTNWLAEVGRDSGSQFIGLIGLVAGSPVATSGVSPSRDWHGNPDRKHKGGENCGGQEYLAACDRCRRAPVSTTWFRVAL